MQPLRQLVTNKSASCCQAFECAVGFFIIALNNHKYLRRTRIRGELHFADIDQAYTRIPEFPFENRFNLLAKSLA